VEALADFQHTGRRIVFAEVSPKMLDHFLLRLRDHVVDTPRLALLPPTIDPEAECLEVVDDLF
jgi:hypothetical protein